MPSISRRRWLKSSLGIPAALVAGPLARLSPALGTAEEPGTDMAFGLVTYLWGKDWDLPTLLANCEKTKVLGVELRTTHMHGVEPDLNKAQRAEVKKRFADSPVTLVGLGSNERFCHKDPKALAAAIEATKAFVRLGHDVGGSGVKVKPNDLYKDVPHGKTIEQIGKALNEVAAFGADFGQEIRLEVHGRCSELPVMKRIMDVADHPNARVCWNSNQADLKGDGLAANFNLVKDRFGATAHVRELDTPGYPWAELIGLLVKMDYRGWVLLEARGKPEDRIAALIQQRELFGGMVRAAQASPSPSGRGSG